MQIFFQFYNIFQNYFENYNAIYNAIGGKKPVFERGRIKMQKNAKKCKKFQKKTKKKAKKKSPKKTQKNTFKFCYFSIIMLVKILTPSQKTPHFTHQKTPIFKKTPIF